MGETPFHDLDDYVAIPRLSGLRCSARTGRGSSPRVATLDPKRTKFVTALWEVDPAGERRARRLTRSAKGECERGVHARRRPAVHLRAPRPGRGGGRRRPGPGAVAAARATAPRRGWWRTGAAGLG